MANQHTKAAEAAKPQAAPDAPNLDDAPDLTAMAEANAELQAQLEAAQAALAAAEAAKPSRTPRPAQAMAVSASPTVAAPDSPTYEEGGVDEDGVAYAATIVVKAPDGTEVECTPKVFRTILAPKGYQAHPTDAAMHLGGEQRRSRRRRAADEDGAPEQATAARRRRRAPEGA